ncbi:MAG: hypothetical protein Q9162_003029 [Coniocarpon cinnabarinum]
MGLPFLRRLDLREYLAVSLSFILLTVESLVRIITLALPTRLLGFLHDRSRALYNALSSPQSKKNRAQHKPVTDPIAHAQDFVDLCDFFGYYAEEHVVHTEDGYLLGLHRLAWRKGEEDQRVNAGPGTIQKKVVYLHHGLMMNSEVWVCRTEKDKALPFVLVDAGYDVWLGNNRGNKYSKKSTKFSPDTHEFWNFSIDQFAFHDIPDSIEYILDATTQSSLSYIGFSQGTAQAFATLSIHPKLNQKVDVFIALAPAMSPPGLANGIVASLVKTSPEVLYLAFGRRSMLSSATMWQALLYPPIFVRCIDTALRFLFGWETQNITQQQKLAAYPHLYSFTSTKSVVHWFQIIRNASFIFFDDEVQRPLSIADGRRYYKVPKFPTRNIRTPVVLVYGGSDSLVNIDVMLKELPKHTVAREVPKYEHLDFLWAADVDKLVFPHVFDALDFHARPVGTTKATESRTQVSRLLSYNSPQPPVYTSEDERLMPGKARQIDGRVSDSFDSPNTGTEYTTPSSDFPPALIAETPAAPSFAAVASARNQSPSRSSVRSRGSTDAVVSPSGISLGASRVAESVVDGASSSGELNSASSKSKKKNKRK